ncbi:MAG: peptidoglycan-binding domain 1 protein [Parcubacteria group bacterium Greene0714_36]|nr:MAG: peptidoglycan-binding domain 1 protein [Parcubacteria group bacterium Greene0714_36]
MKQQIAAVQQQIVQKISAAGSAVGTAVSLIAKNLKLGDRNDEVRTLQQLLARDTAIYPEGLATGLFGPATQRAVKKFQEKYGIQQLGIVGPQTRAKLAEVFGGVTAPSAPPSSPVAQPSPVSAVSAGIPSRVLSPGTRDDQVRALQQLLASDPDIYPEGTVSGFYGPATTRAVRLFQLKHGVIQSATDAGNGNVGPKTLQKMKEIFGGAPAPSPTPVAPAVPAPAVAPSASAGTPATAASANDAQVKSVQEQIQALQAKILQEQIKLIQEKINALKK